MVAIGIVYMKLLGLYAIRHIYYRKNLTLVPHNGLHFFNLINISMVMTNKQFLLLAMYTPVRSIVDTMRVKTFGPQPKKLNIPHFTTMQVSD